MPAPESRIPFPLATAIGALLGALVGNLVFPFDRFAPADFALHVATWIGRGIAVTWVALGAARLRNQQVVAALAGGAAGLLLALVLEPGAGAYALFIGAALGIVAGAFVQAVGTLPGRERPLALLMSSFFFLVINIFWVLKPTKKTLFISYYKDRPFDLLGTELKGSEAELVAKVLNMVVAALAVTAFTWLARRFQRQHLVGLCCGFFAAAFAAYAAALGRPGEATVWSYYLFGDLFSTVMVAAFFAFLNDSVSPGQAKRLYGLVVFGGVFGGAFGATATNEIAKQVGTAPLLLGCVAGAGLIALLAFASGGVVRRGEAPAAEAPPPAPERGGNPALEGARLALASPYLLAVVGMVGLYEFVSTTMDFQWTAFGEARLARADLGAYIGNTYRITNWAGMFVQLFLTRLVMQRLGIGIALLVLPAAALLSSGSFFLVPGLAVAAALSISDNSLNYSINQSARESLYTPTSRDAKYKAKAFIDMFVQRAAKAAAVGLSLLFASLGSGAVRYLAIVSVVLLLVWMGLARFAGRRFEAMTAEETRTE